MKSEVCQLPPSLVLSCLVLLLYYAPKYNLLGTRKILTTPLKALICAPWHQSSSPNSNTTLHCLPCSFRMVNFHDPAQLTRGFGPGAYAPLTKFCSKKKKAHWVHLLTAPLKDVRAITAAAASGLYMWVGTRPRLSDGSLIPCIQMGVRHYS